MTKYERIVFVGMDNTCRSVMAETIFRSLMEEGEWETASRGIVVLFPEPFNKKLEMVLYSRGLHTLSKNSVPLEPEELREGTLVLTVSLMDKVKLMEAFDYQEDVYTIKEFLNEDGEITNPYGEDVDVYEACYEEMHGCMERVVGQLREMAKESDHLEDEGWNEKEERP